MRSLLEYELRREEEVFEGESRPLEAAGRPRLHSVDQVSHESRVNLVFGFAVDRSVHSGLRTYMSKKSKDRFRDPAL